MAQMNVIEALRAAMAWEMERDSDVVILGEDVGTAGGISAPLRACRTASDPNA